MNIITYNKPLSGDDACKGGKTDISDFEKLVVKVEKFF